MDDMKLKLSEAVAARLSAAPASKEKDELIEELSDNLYRRFLEMSGAGVPEEEAFKYFDIFKKTLSGGIGRNMLNMEFPLDQEMPGGTQEFLMKLKNSKLEDDMLLEEFYDKI